ncbi:MAG: DUF167 domain-containing protein [Candidatus Hydrogenedentes bacterium]|nr:DUF167 domain-containing protein [Candidatus Hydrogenedentota bacterium]
MERGVLNKRRNAPDANATSCRITVRVQPRASRNGCSVESDGRVRVAVTAPPVDSEANDAVVAFIADCLALPKRSVRVVVGAKSRNKTIAVDGLDLDVVVRRLRENA